MSNFVRILLCVSRMYVRGQILVIPNLVHFNQLPSNAINHTQLISFTCIDHGFPQHTTQ